MNGCTRTKKRLYRSVLQKINNGSDAEGVIASAFALMHHLVIAPTIEMGLF